MVLEKDKNYTSKELATWFKITDNSFCHARLKKLKELEEYAKFDIITTKTGRFKSVYITEVYYDTYYKSYKKDLIKFIDDQSNWECILDNGYSNIEILINYYCEVKKLKYKDSGGHYHMIDVVGRTEDNKEKVIQEKRKRNSENYKLWFYLYDTARRYINKKQQLDYYSKEDCCVDSYFPLKLKLSTEEMKKERVKIYAKYFGNNPYYGDDQIEVYNIVDVEEEQDERTIKELKEELRQTKMFLTLSDKQKREAYFRELIEKGLYPTKGYKMGSHIENKLEKSKIIDKVEEGEFGFEFE